MTNNSFFNQKGRSSDRQEISLFKKPKSRFVRSILPAITISALLVGFFGLLGSSSIELKEASSPIELERQHRLLYIVSMGMGASAIVSVTLGCLSIKSTIRSAINSVRAAAEKPDIGTNNYNHLLTEAIREIRSSLQERDILENSVETVRRILNCQRVMVYSREDKYRGLAIAESVELGWPRVLGETIIDPCFEARYDRSYQNGRVRAVDNIYEGGLTSCYIERLEKLAVKANLVAPIVSEGKLLALLVAHHCSAPRHWQEWEIDLFSQIATQIGFAIDNARLSAEYSRLQQKIEAEARWTDYFAEAITNIRASSKEESILETTVKEVRRVVNCDRVLIYSLEEKSRGVVIAESVAPGWTRALGKMIADPCFESGYRDKYENGRVSAIDDIYNASMTPCYVEQLEKLEVKANLVAPIINEGKLLGLLVAHQCSAARTWERIEIGRFALIAAQVGLAIDNARSLQKNAPLIQKAEIVSCIQKKEKKLLGSQAPQSVQKGSSVSFYEASQRQADNSTAIMEKIREVIGVAENINTKARQAEQRNQEIQEKLQSGQKLLDLSIESIDRSREQIDRASEEIKQLFSSLKKFPQTIDSVRKLAEQINIKAINSRIRNEKTAEESENYLVFLSETVIATMNKIKEIIDSIENSVDFGRDRANKLNEFMETFKTNLALGNELLGEFQRQIDGILESNNQTDLLLEETAKNSIKQLDSSIYIEKSVLELLQFSRQASERSMAVLACFEELGSKF